MVCHFAANADVRFGTEHPRRDLEQNTIATYNVLEAMRANGIKQIAFSSTGVKYGYTGVHGCTWITERPHVLETGGYDC